uniref:BTB domain-containing protein n=1 Tax=Acrobeloides nanus TaxID=290746 RepID=A0A914C644_9BILA
MDSDICFLVGPDEKKIFGNKDVLANKSKVFYQMFYGELATNDREIKLPDDEPESFSALLNFINSNEADVNDENVIFVYMTAQKYDIPELEQFCLVFLRVNMKIEDAFTLLDQAQKLNQPRFEKLAWMEIDRNAEDAVQTPQFLELPHNIIIEFVKRDSLVIQELSLFKGVLNWAEAECRRQKTEPTLENRKKVLGEVINLIETSIFHRDDQDNSVEETRIQQENDRKSELLMQIAQNLMEGNSLQGRFPHQEEYLYARRDRPNIIRLTETEIMEKKFRLQYNCSMDRYTRFYPNRDISFWQRLAYINKNIFRNQEQDHRKVYLCREPKTDCGEIGWKIDLYPAHLKKIEVTLNGLFCCDASKTCKHVGCLLPKVPGSLEVEISCNGVSKTVPPNKESDETVTFEDFSWETEYLDISVKFGGGGKHNVHWQFAQIFRTNLARSRSIGRGHRRDADEEESNQPNMVISMEFY